MTRCLLCFLIGAGTVPILKLLGHLAYRAAYATAETRFVYGAGWHHRTRPSRFLFACYAIRFWVRRAVKSDWPTTEISFRNPDGTRVRYQRGPQGKAVRKP